MGAEGLDVSLGQVERFPVAEPPGSSGSGGEGWVGEGVGRTGKGDKCPCATLSPWSCRVRSPVASLQLCVHLCDRNIPAGIVKSCLQFTS